jgi:tetratricopeptide (TPR) repeat protein
MEREKYWLVSLLLVITISVNAQTSYRTDIYKAYLTGKMDNWKIATDKMEKAKGSGQIDLLELINYQYGYTAWSLGNRSKKEAETYLALMDKNLEKLRCRAGETAEYHAYTAASYGFKIGLNNLRAPFYGRRSMNHAEKALELDDQNIQANIEMGNIWNHMPELFGGSKEKAFQYYLKALKSMESGNSDLRKSNWNYLNLLVLLGQTQRDMGNHKEAYVFFNKAVNIEPGFIWVKDELLPSLNN